jgi:hypothetical protein
MARCFTRAVAVSLLLFAGCANKATSFDPGNVESVDVRLDDWQDRQKGAEASTRDASKITELIAVLRKGEPATDHKCGTSGWLILHQEGGRTCRVGILAGHNPRYYEFRVYRGEGSRYDMYRVEREPFLKAMSGVGLDQLDPGPDR